MENKMENINFSDKVKLIAEDNLGKNSISQIKTKANNYLLLNNLPTLKHEDWKYTNLAFFKKFNFEFDMAFNSDFNPDNFKIKDLDAYHIFSLNGKLNLEISDYPENIIIKELDSEIEIDNIEDIRKTYFSQLNTAMFKNSIFLEVKKNQQIDKPIHIIHINDGNSNDIAINSRRFFNFADNTEATIIESFFAVGENKSFFNGVAEVNVGENAVIHHVKLQQDENSDILIDFVQAQQAKYSNYVNLTFTNGGNFVRNNLNARLNDENIESHFLGVFIGDGNNVIDNHTFVDHAKPNCFSNENYRGILFDKSTGIFNGKILVRPDAQKTNAYQSNKNILASKDATINTKPELEIYADDVKCSHGATSGSLDKSSLFYLRARGIDEIKAESLLMNAFVSEVVDELKNQQLKNYLHSITRKKLNDDLHFVDEEDLININDL